MESSYYGLVFRFPLLSTRGYGPDAVTFSYWPLSVGQVEDFHLAVKMRFQAHFQESPDSCIRVGRAEEMKNEEEELAAVL
jgi:hypothetical protein